MDNAKLLLMKQLKELNKNPVEGFSAGLKDDSDPFKWEIMIMGPPDTPYEGGFFQAEMNFPHEYPNLPPKLKFTSEFYHPNVYADGTVCISILHAPGEDQFGYEQASERWLPIHSVESSARTTRTAHRTRLSSHRRVCSPSVSSAFGSFSSAPHLRLICASSAPHLLLICSSSAPHLLLI